MKQDNAKEMLPEYDFSKGVRGKYAKQYAEGSNIVILSPDVAAAFPNSDAVNEALRGLLTVARQSIKLETSNFRSNVKSKR